MNLNSPEWKSVVVELKRPEPIEKRQCWECGCGSQTFVLLAEGDVMCSECKAIMIDLRHFEP